MKKLDTTRDVLLWAESAGEFYFHVGKQHARNVKTAAQIARAVRIAKTVEKFAQFLEEQWGAEEIKVQYVLRRLGDAAEGGANEGLNDD